MNRLSFLVLWGLLVSTSATLFAQANLSVQGTIQRSFGAAVDDGNYSLTFRLYETDAGGTPIWEETQDAVEVIGGVYSVVLGEAEPLDAPFDQPYFLGVSVDGGTELTPRARLTSAPYALSLIGQDNTFPSSGTVGIGTTEPDDQQRLHVVGNTKLEGDLEITGTVTGIEVDFENITSDINTSANISAEGTVSAGNGIELPTGQSISYNGKNDWRLVEVDDFSQDTEGWVCQRSWRESDSRNFERFSPGTPFSQGYILRPTDFGSHALKKQFDLSDIPHSEVKVVFTYHFFETWGGDRSEFGYAAFATSPTPAQGSDNGQFQIGWVHRRVDAVGFGGTGYVDLYPPNNTLADYNMRAEMMAQTDADTFWLIVSSNVDQSADDESYGISNVEIWVR
ncbi:hypothetical protein [Phaeodactylibacter xiamenensis]|uniref:hypothetical protein n=1 Tax=Phaeodactylibacter xiamenensis TaxID=1524460 RepID=UPI0024A9DB65|nr:hypothetical protein [Phaeodactylibacter xiamenensis]